MIRKHSAAFAVVGAVLAGILLGVLVFFIYRGHENRVAAEYAQEIVAVRVPEETPEPTPTPTPTPTPVPTPTPYEPPQELLNYQTKNPHVIALLDIPGTDIHYPILQHPTTDDYYLNITIDGYSGYPGSIYTNLMEGKNFETFNTVIYGHNMSDGSMFGTLRLFEDRDYMLEHREIDIYTNVEKHVYQCCAIVVYDDRYITYTYYDDVVADRAAYLRSLQGGTWLDDIEVTTDSHIITLSTCIGGMPDNRRLLIAVEEEEEPDFRVVLPS